MNMLNNINRNIVMIENPMIKKDLYIYTETGLPKNGWLQGCYNCGDITSNFNHYKKIYKSCREYDINIYLCRRCNKYYINRYREFIDFMKYCNKKYKDDIYKKYNISLF